MMLFLICNIPSQIVDLRPAQADSPTTVIGLGS